MMLDHPTGATDLTLLPIRRGEDAQGATSTARAGYRATGGQKAAAAYGLPSTTSVMIARIGTLERAIGFGLRHLMPWRARNSAGHHLGNTGGCYAGGWQYFAS